MIGLKKTKPKLKKFLDALCSTPTTPIDEIPTTHARINFGKEMATIVQFLHNNINQIPNTENLIDLTRLRTVVHRLMSNDTTQYDHGDDETLEDSHSENTSPVKKPNITDSPSKNQHDSDESSLASAIQGSDEISSQKRTVESNLTEDQGSDSSLSSSESNSEDEFFNVDRSGENGFSAGNMLPEDKLLCAVQFLKENILLVHRLNTTFNTNVSNLIVEHSHLQHFAESMSVQVGAVVEASKADNGRKQ